MISYIGFKVEVPKNIMPRYYSRACTIIKILERIGYKNTGLLNGYLHNSTTYLIAVHDDIYKYISNNYPNKESYILTSGLGSLKSFYKIRCILSNSIYNTNFGSDSYSKVLVLNATTVLNTYKLLL